MVTNSLVSTKRFEALSPPPPLMPQLASPLVLQALATALAKLEQKIDALSVREPQPLAPRPVQARTVESREVQADPVPSQPPQTPGRVRVKRSRLINMFD